MLLAVAPASVLEVHRQVAGRVGVAAAGWFALTVTPRDERLMVQATGQEEFEGSPENGTRSFCRIVDAQVTFEQEADGSVPALVLRQNERGRRGRRLPWTALLPGHSGARRQTASA